MSEMMKKKYEMTPSQKKIERTIYGITLLAVIASIAKDIFASKPVICEDPPFFKKVYKEIEEKITKNITNR